MHKRLTSLGLCLIFLVVEPAVSAADQFDQVKAKLAEANCIDIRFLSILRSDVFDRTDTSKGTATLDKDGRYFVTVGQDQFLCTGKELYSYSPQSNQVVIQRVDSGQAKSSEVAYIRRLDDWYKTTILKPNRQYRLVRTGPADANIPDSMIVYLDKKGPRIAKIEYYDLNDELVTILFINERFEAACDPARFRPNFPDSAQTVKL